jgi:purine-cytosine permease-like protein
MQSVEIGPVPAGERTQSAADLFLIFAGANIVATTLPVGPRLGVPSVVAARAALGMRGAALVALLLYVTNFAWIAVNNVIAASACARLLGGPGSERIWAVALGLMATAIVAGGPRAVALADRYAVPLLAVVGILFTIACLRASSAVLAAPITAPIPWNRGLDVVIGYQVSWILMFADYSRYTASPGRGALAVFLGLALTSLWFMPLGFAAARVAGSDDPGAMLSAVHLGAAGAVLLALATLTTNFVNIYLSALAWKSLLPKAGQALTIWSIGVIGAGLSLSRIWLDRYADFMLLLGALLVRRRRPHRALLPRRPPHRRPRPLRLQRPVREERRFLPARSPCLVRRRCRLLPRPPHRQHPPLPRDRHCSVLDRPPLAAPLKATPIIRLKLDAV